MTILYETDRFKIVRNGAGIEMIRKADNQSTYLQAGDESNQFEDEIEACVRKDEQGDSNLTLDQMINHVCDPY